MIMQNSILQQKDKNIQQMQQQMQNVNISQECDSSNYFQQIIQDAEFIDNDNNNRYGGYFQPKNNSMMEKALNNQESNNLQQQNNQIQKSSQIEQSSQYDNTSIDKAMISFAKLFLNGIMSLECFLHLTADNQNHSVVTQILNSSLMKGKNKDKYFEKLSKYGCFINQKTQNRLFNPKFYQKLLKLSTKNKLVPYIEKYMEQNALNKKIYFIDKNSCTAYLGKNLSFNKNIAKQVYLVGDTIIKSYLNNPHTAKSYSSKEFLLNNNGNFYQSTKMSGGLNYIKLSDNICTYGEANNLDQFKISSNSIAINKNRTLFFYKDKNNISHEVKLDASNLSFSNLIKTCKSYEDLPTILTQIKTYITDIREQKFIKKIRFVGNSDILSYINNNDTLDNNKNANYTNAINAMRNGNNNIADYINAPIQLSYNKSIGEFYEAISIDLIAPQANTQAINKFLSTNLDLIKEIDNEGYGVIINLTTDRKKSNLVLVKNNDQYIYKAIDIDIQDHNTDNKSICPKEYTETHLPLSSPKLLHEFKPNKENDEFKELREKIDNLKTKIYYSDQYENINDKVVIIINFYAILLTAIQLKNHKIKFSTLDDTLLNENIVNTFGQDSMAGELIKRIRVTITDICTTKNQNKDEDKQVIIEDIYQQIAALTINDIAVK